MSARLHITVYRHLAVDDFNRVTPIPMVPPVTEMFVEIGATSSQSDPFPKFSRFIMVKPDVSCALDFGTDPVANPDYHFVEAGERMWYGVEEGDKIAVVEVI